LGIRLPFDGRLADRFDPSRQPHDRPRWFRTRGFFRMNDTDKHDGCRGGEE
jgi:hypothetical protein